MARSVRRAWQVAVVSALCALAGCQVPTEGAPCQSDASCPRGQRCGADLRCSVKAAKCTGCADGEKACVEKDLLHCTKAPDGICRLLGDPAARGEHQVCDDTTEEGPRLVCERTDCTGEGRVCPNGATWITCVKDEQGCLHVSESEPSVPCAPGLVCGSVATGCVCPPAAAGVFYVDPVEGSQPDADPTPNGAQAPARCRFKTLGPALAAANERATSSVGATATVVVSSAGEALPPLEEAAIELMPGVTLTSDAPTSPTGPPADLPYVLEVSGAGTPSVPGAPGVPGVTLHEGATFSKLKLQPAAVANVTDAIVTSCASGATQPAVVQDAMVLGTNGEGRFGNGVHQKGGCPITVERTLLQGNEVGVRGEGGGAASMTTPLLEVEACTVSGGKTGIFLEPVTGSTANAEIKGTRVEGADDTGIQLRNMAASTVTLAGNTVTRNCGHATYPSTSGDQRAGGILFYGTLPTTTFTGNSVLENGWNQVLVFRNDGTLTLSGGTEVSDCNEPASAINRICANAGNGQPGVGVFSTGARVTAWYNRWRYVPPQEGVDYGGIEGAIVDLVGSTNNYCPQAVTCEAIQCPP